MPERVRVSIDGRELELSNLDKVLYPEVGVTKGEVIDYYVRVAPYLLPHLADPGTGSRSVRTHEGVPPGLFFSKKLAASTPLG